MTEGPDDWSDSIWPYYVFLYAICPVPNYARYMSNHIIIYIKSLCQWYHIIMSTTSIHSTNTAIHMYMCSCSPSIPMYYKRRNRKNQESQSVSAQQSGPAVGKMLLDLHVVSSQGPKQAAKSSQGRACFRPDAMRPVARIHGQAVDLRTQQRAPS